ncbi:MAG: alkaline phosphatase D family protein [Candidatus Sericytochromatia bacterium]
MSKWLSALGAAALGLSLQAGAEAAARITAGPMVGHTDTGRSTLWLQSSEPTAFQIRYRPVAAPESLAQLSPVAATTAEQFLTGTVTLTGLTPGTRYQYEVLIDGQPASLPQALSFATAPAWSPGQSNPADVSILVGSCYYLDDPLMKWFNISYGSGTEIFSAMARQGGDMMLWLGDNIYFAPFDLSNAYNMNRRYAAQRQLPELQPFLSMMPHVAVWDDHDFGPNNSNKFFWQRDDSYRLFKTYWANPRYGLTTSPGVFFKTQWGDVDVIMTDDRYYRDSNESTDPKRDYFGRAQLEWIKQELLASRATFKVLVVGSPVLNQHYEESMRRARGEYEELLAWLDSQRIEGVVLLSGDRHHSDLMKLERPGSYPLYNYTNSPLTSEPTKILGVLEANDELRVPGSLLRQRNYGRLFVSGPAGERVMSLEAYDTQGKKLWSHAISERELKFPATP